MSFIGLNKNVFLILIVSHNLSVCIYTYICCVFVCVCVDRNKSDLWHNAANEDNESQ